MNEYDSCIFLSGDNTVEWKDVFSKMKPGAHAVAICPVLKHHRITQSIEDSGFEIRDSILFLGEPSFIATLARVPLEGTVAENVLKHGVGALNVDECRIDAPDNKGKVWVRGGAGVNARSGPKAAQTKQQLNGETELVKPHEARRWPANCILGGNMDEKFPVTTSGGGVRRPKPWKTVNAYFFDQQASDYKMDASTGSAARFFYNVTEDDKLQGLVAYLHKLITPPGGKVLVYNVPADAIMELRNKSSDIIEFS